MRNGSIVDEAGKLNNFAIEPPMYVQDEPRVGFTAYAELINGRLAMVGFVSLLTLEVLSHHGLINNLLSL